MALENGSESMVMPVQPMGGYGYNNGGFGFGGDGGWWIILFLFAMFGGWGNGFGGGFGGDGMFPWLLASNNNTNDIVQDGFNQAATAGTLAGIQSSLTSGFANAETAACNRAMDSMQTAYNNQIASMNQNFANQMNLQDNLNAINSSLNNCCCENRAAVADLKYTVATEACADRAAVNDALRDVLTANTANTQRILDVMCQDKIDAKNERIADLERQLTMANLAASQQAQTAAILANNEAQTSALEQYLAPVPRPAYIVQNPNCCSQNYGCGCGNF